MRGSADYVRRLGRWDDARPLPYWLGGAGAVAFTSGLLAVLSVKGVVLPRWLSITSGLVGVALAGWGIAEVARGGPCEDNVVDRRSCGDAREQRDRGALFLLSATPFVAVPLFALTRPARSAKRASVVPAWSPSTQTLTLSLSISSP